MADESYRKTYYQADFTALGGSIAENKPLLEAALAGLDLTVPVNEVRLALGGAAAIVEWAVLPLQADVQAVDALVAAFAGGTTTSQPLEFNSFPAETSSSSDPVTKIEVTTAPLDAGTYQVLWTSSLRMATAAANAGVQGKVRLERSDGAFVEQTDAWDLNVNHAFNGGITFQVQAGQTIHATLSFNRLGAAGVAEMSGARVTIDQLSAG